MKRWEHLTSLFLRFTAVIGGVGLGAFLLKVWYLQHILERQGIGEHGFEPMNYGGLLFLDASMLLLLGVILWRSYRRRLARPIGQLSEMIEQMQIQQGDVAAELAAQPCAEIHTLAQATSSMLKQVNVLLRQCHDVGRAMLETSHGVFTVSKQQGAHLAEHASGFREMGIALHELVDTAQEMTLEVQAVVEVASRTVELAEQGRQAVLKVAQGMEEIRQAFQRSADQIVALGKHSEHINEVVTTIDRIIEDTTLIAFNATIEAARAREEGRGFGVVALEIKRLAEEVFESTEDIKNVIQDIHGASHALVRGTEDEMHTVYRGARLAQEAGDSLAQIVAMATLTTESAQRIASATQQQKGASEQVFQAVETASHAVRRFAQESQQVAGTAAELSILAESLRRILAGFGGSEYGSSASDS